MSTRARGDGSGLRRRAEAHADVGVAYVRRWGLAIGGLMIPILGLSFAGHGDVWQGLTTIIEQQPERMAPMGDSEANIPWHTLFTGVTLLTTCYW